MQGEEEQQNIKSTAVTSCLVQTKEAISSFVKPLGTSKEASIYLDLSHC